MDSTVNELQNRINLLENDVLEVDKKIAQLEAEQNETRATRWKSVDEIEELNDRLNNFLLLGQHRDKITELLNNPHGLSGYTVFILERVLAEEHISFEEKNIFCSVMLNKFNILIES